MTQRLKPLACVLLAGGLGLALAGCLPTPLPPTATPTLLLPQRLRVHNAGPTAIKSLVVGFAQDRITFGDIPAGATTDYQTVPHGVLRYAAYTFQMEGRDTTQPVMDFIGEQPLPGSDFTYSVDYDPGRFAQNEAIKLLSVTTNP